jgi:metal-sulfur cluster biosynthetic enzyme
MGREAVDELETKVRHALSDVMDPHMNVSLFDMGMVRRLDVTTDGAVTVGIVFPCIGCPAWQTLQQEIRERIASVPGVAGVKVRIEWDKVWDRNDMSKQARDRAATYGYVA